MILKVFGSRSLYLNMQLFTPELQCTMKRVTSLLLLVQYLINIPHVTERDIILKLC
jgi:hypothetical protein